MRPTCSEAGCRAAGRRLALAGLLCLTACATLSHEQEAYLGAQVEQQMRRELPLMRDRVVVGYVTDIGARILRAAGPQPFGYHFYVVADPEINAFAAPAGHIYVHTETILRARNVDELAGVIAHEVGHVVHRHIAENYNRQRNVGIAKQLGVAAAGAFGGGYMAGAANLGGSLAGMAFLNTFSREAEQEADSFAVQVMPKAGYDPNGLVSFFDLLLHEPGGGGGAPGFLSSHPTTTERIYATHAQIAAQPREANPRVFDHGRLEIIQRRIRLLNEARY